MKSWLCHMPHVDVKRTVALALNLISTLAALQRATWSCLRMPCLAGMSMYSACECAFTFGHLLARPSDP